MAKELEVKVLGISIEEIIKKLESIGASFDFDKVQNIYTYDFINIPSMYHSILFDLNRNSNKKEIEHAKNRLKNLFFDLNDLIIENDISGEQRQIIKNLFGKENLYDVIKNINHIDSKTLELLNNSELLKIIEGYGINPNKWIRLRKNGEKASITVKHILGRKTLRSGVRVHDINNVLEFEIQIDSFETAKTLLEQMGYYHKNYQEKRRIQYTYNSLEIVMDSWPHIPPYIEIEGKNEDDIFNLLSKLGYKKEDTVSMNTDDVYTYYGLDMYSYKELKFNK